MAKLSWNNPGNIGFGNFAAGYGATNSGVQDTGHGIAAFPTPQAGVQALNDLALSKYDGGKTSLNSLIAGQGGWTPGNYTAAGNIANTMGISPSDDLNLHDPATMQSFDHALSTQEGYGGASSQDYFFAGAGTGTGASIGSDGGDTFNSPAYGTDDGGNVTGTVTTHPGGSYVSVTDAEGTDPFGGSGTGTTTATGGAGTASTQAPGSAGFSSGAASGDDSSEDGGLMPINVPIAITTSQAAADKTANANTAAINKTNTADTNSIVGVVKSFYNSGHAALGDTLFRVALITVGVVLLLGALMIIAGEENGNGIVASGKAFTKQAAEAVAA